MSINIVYSSTTGNIKRFLTSVKPYAESMGFIIKLISVDEAIKSNFKGNCHLFIPTRGFGEIPQIVEDYLKVFKPNILSVSGSGNRNWGANFCKAVYTISERYKVPILTTIELSGTSNEVSTYAYQLIDFLKYNRDNEKLHSA